jgi:hypothetical protein
MNSPETEGENVRGLPKDRVHHSESRSRGPLAAFSISDYSVLFGGQVAQLVEQWTENPRVAGSSPALTTHSKTFENNVLEFFYAPLGEATSATAWLLGCRLAANIGPAVQNFIALGEGVSGKANRIGLQFTLAQSPRVPEGLPPMRLFLAALMICLLSAVSTEAVEFSVEKEQGGLAIKIDGKAFTHYRTLFQNKPILHPIIGPSGVEMTRSLESGDHIHHASLWFTHGGVNGVDFWHKKGLIEHQEFAEIKGGDTATVTVVNHWKDNNGKQLGTELRTMNFSLDGNSRVIDFDIVFTAAEKVTFAKTKEGSFGVRTNPSITVDKGGNIVNSEGQADGAAWGKPAAWVDYHGKVGDKHIGIAILNHPKSFRFPNAWHVRGYGLFAANPFMKQAHELEKGETMQLKYRVVFHDGDSKAADIAGIYDRYTK